MPLQASSSLTRTIATQLIPEIYQDLGKPFSTTIAGQEHFTNLSSLVTSDGKAVYAPVLGRTSAITNYNPGNQVDPIQSTIIEHKLELNLTSMRPLQIPIDTMAGMLRSGTQLETLISEMRDSIEVTTETSIFSACNFGQAYGASTASIQSLYIRQAMSYLMQQEGLKSNYNDFALFIRPSAWQQLAGINEFSSLNQYGVAVNLDGQLPTIYGVPVRVTTRLPANTAVIAHKNAIIYAKQSDVVNTTFENVYQSMLTVAFRRYGVLKIRDNAGVIIRHTE